MGTNAQRRRAARQAARVPGRRPVAVTPPHDCRDQRACSCAAALDERLARSGMERIR